MTQQEMQEIIKTVIAMVGGQATATASGRKPNLAKKDASILATFKRRGFKDVVLMDRSNPKVSFNIRPFKGWLEQGRVVRKGEKGVRGLFHVSQTDAVEAPKGVATAATKAKDSTKPVLTLKSLNDLPQQPTA